MEESGVATVHGVTKSWTQLNDFKKKKKMFKWSHKYL